MTIKKQFKPIIAFLEANQGEQVEHIMGQLLELASSARADETVIYCPDSGQPLAIFCYYHKQWEPLAIFDYGKKQSTKSRLNTMCKEGASHWHKQWQAGKKAEAAILDDLTSGKIQVEQIQGIKRLIERDRFAIVPSEEVGFSLEEDARRSLGLIKI